MTNDSPLQAFEWGSDYQSKELRQFNIYKMHSNFNLEFYTLPIAKILSTLAGHWCKME